MTDPLGNVDDFEKGCILNIQNGNYEYTQITVQEARDFQEECEHVSEDFNRKVDLAQAKVFSGDHNITLLIIVITKD
jgi:hypothetical protein